MQRDKRSYVPWIIITTCVMSGGFVYVLFNIVTLVRAHSISLFFAQLLAQQCLYDRCVVTRCYSWAIYIEFGMSQSKLHCTNVGDEPVKNYNSTGFNSDRWPLCCQLCHKPYGFLVLLISVFFVQMIVHRLIQTH